MTGCTYFTVAGLAAALHGDVEQVRMLVGKGLIRPEYVEGKEPRWSRTALMDIIKELLPVPQGRADLEKERAMIIAMALSDADRAEEGGRHA